MFNNMNVIVYVITVPVGQLKKITNDKSNGSNFKDGTWNYLTWFISSSMMVFFGNKKCILTLNCSKNYIPNALLVIYQGFI